MAAGLAALGCQKQHKRFDLTVDPVIVASADKLVIYGVLPAGDYYSESELIIRDSSGKIVYKRHGQLNASLSALDIASGYPSKPLPGSLAPGLYSMVWTVDGERSNETRFEVGSGTPDFLTAEYSGGRCAESSLMVHAFLEQPLDYCRLVMGLVVGVDGNEGGVFSNCSEAVRGLSTQGAFTLGVPPWRLQLAPSKSHEVWVRFEGHRSKTVRVKCEST